MKKKNKKKFNVQEAVAKEFGGGSSSNYKGKIKSLIILIAMIVALAFFVIPFIIGMGFSFFSGGLAVAPHFITGLIIAGLVIYLGGWL
jgi:hypothetical protein